MIHPRHVLRVVPLAVMALFLGGCGNFNFLNPFGATAPLQIQSVERKGTLIQPNFANATYYPDSDRVVHLVADAEGTDPATGKPVRQILVMRIFWIPLGGRTSLNPTSLNFTFRYLVIAPDSAGQYEGAGFARLNDEPDAASLPIRVIDADLRLTEKTANFTDVLQRCRVLGTITARRDDPGTIERLYNAEREFFNTTLEISKTRPATVPATTPAPAPQTLPATTTAPAPTQPATVPETVPFRY